MKNKKKFLRGNLHYITSPKGVLINALYQGVVEEEKIPLQCIDTLRVDILERI